MGKVTVRHGTVATGASSVVVLPANLRRTGFVFTNTGAQSVSILKGDGPAISGEGVVIATTNSFSESNGENFNCWKGQISAISAAGASSIAFMEQEESGLFG